MVPQLGQDILVFALDFAREVLVVFRGAEATVIIIVVRVLLLLSVVVVILLLLIILLLLLLILGLLLLLTLAGLIDLYFDTLRILLP